jgi:hypothetical protein
MRALVIPAQGILGGASLALLRGSETEFEQAIEERLSLPPGSVFVDLPHSPSFDRTGQFSRGNCSGPSFGTCEEAFSYNRGVAGYAQYRYRTYVFEPHDDEANKVGQEAVRQLKRRGIKVDGQLCLQLTKRGHSDQC